MKLRLKVKGKKSGIVGSALTDFWSYVILVFVVVIFFVFFGITAYEGVEKVIDKDGKLNTDVYAVNYLRVPVDIEIEDGQVYIAQDTNLADFIQQNLFQLNNAGSFEDRQRIIKDIFEAKIADNKNYYRLMFFIGNDPGYDYLSDACLYDDFRDTRQITLECLDIETDKVEGFAIVPFPFGTKNFEFFKVVLQNRQS